MADNFASNFFAGQDQGLRRQATQLQLQQAQNLNALNANPQATPEQYLRAGDSSTATALQGLQDKQQNDSSQSVARVGTIATRALSITDPAQRKGFLQQAISAYGNDFKVLGADPSQLPAMLAMPDDQLQQKLQQVAQFAPPPKEVTVPQGGTFGTADTSGKFTPSYTAPNPGQEETARHNKAMEGFAGQRAATTASFSDPEIGELLGSLASRGISLPAGLRSKDQQLATLRGLLNKYPGSSADEIVEKVATGQVDFGAIKKETTTAAAQAGRVAIAVNELKTFGDQVLEASKAVPRAKFIPANTLMQMTDSSISDPALLRLKIKLTALNNAFDQLSARGGTDAAKREHIHALFNSATSDEGIQTLVTALNEEGVGATNAASKATRYRSPDASADTPAPAATSGPVSRTLVYDPASGTFK